MSPHRASFSSKNWLLKIPPFWGMRRFLIFLQITGYQTKTGIDFPPEFNYLNVNEDESAFKTMRLKSVLNSYFLRLLMIRCPSMLLISLIICHHSSFEGGDCNNMETVLTGVCNNTQRDILGPFWNDWQAVKGEKSELQVICFQSCEMASWNRREVQQSTGMCIYTLPSLD